ncbi:hypothetical protein SLE2022_371270 [Rubroshorea leprosula]|uniref:Uncharacterized protein n=1 Tax=Rubroshorea leprosula TaxID=152421 RepID=A0AAV5JNV3_9ROSI|nr:hypothetical protein SLEP1_g26950 [Rubroshorea leprosula]
MFDSAIEMITQVASNSLLVFCLCNLIIAIILIGSKPSSTSHQDTTIHLSVVSEPKRGNRERMKAQYMSKKHNSTLYVDGTGVSYATTNSDKKEKEGTMENHKNNIPGNCEEDGQENNDELRRRAEEFIAKVNGEWRAEQFRIVS